MTIYRPGTHLRVMLQLQKVASRGGSSTAGSPHVGNARRNTDVKGHRVNLLDDLGSHSSATPGDGP